MFFLLKLLKLGEIDGVKFLAGGVNFLTNSMSGMSGFPYQLLHLCMSPMALLPSFGLKIKNLSRALKALSETE